MRLPDPPPPVSHLLDQRSPQDVMRLMSSGIGKLPANAYHHWSKLKYLTPPEGFSAEDWWLAIKLARLASAQELPLMDRGGQPFRYSDAGHLHRLLHEVDRAAAGRIEVGGDVLSQESRDRYLASSVMEEAITSSQLEGASTTRLVAKAMLRAGRSPRDLSERMILNNYRGLELARDLVGEELSLPMLLDLHATLTQGTLDQRAVGRLRDKDDVAVVDERDGTLLHQPPPAADLPIRLTRLTDFANASEGSFLHPVVKAILLHFMIGYEHPFVDGNGRAARTLFYWAMAKAGYWITEYLTISTIIRKAPAQYARAYLLSERDDNDVSYFLDYNLRVYSRAIGQLRAYLGRKAREAQDTERLLKRTVRAGELNHRQVALVASLNKHPESPVTIAEHRRYHNVTYQTARTDLLELVELGLVTASRTNRQGRAFHFSLASNPT